MNYLPEKFKDALLKKICDIPVIQEVEIIVYGTNRKF
jgi:hypothetical protein